MKLKDFFNSEIVSLPKASLDDNLETFDRRLAAVFERYIQQLGSLSDLEFPAINAALREITTGAHNLAIAIIDCVRMSLAGKVHSAYQELTAQLAVLDLNPFVSDLVGSSNGFNLGDQLAPYLYAIKHPSLYRIRVNRNEFVNLDRGDIFHVPFEMRHLVTNQRYSIAGLPCLYLGSSLWICWEELGRPSLDSVWVSRYKLVNPLKVLDFQFPPHHVWPLFETLKEDRSLAADRSSEQPLREHFSLDLLRAYLVCWPLLAACSIQREIKSSPFVPEYIVPQLILQWVAQEGLVDGIRYFSVRMPSKGPHMLAHSNCVFPVKTVSYKGYCSRLKKDFALTEPLSWESLAAINLGSPSQITNTSANAWAFVQMSKDLVLSYSETSFHSVEEKLKQIELEKNYSRIIEP